MATTKGLGLFGTLLKARREALGLTRKEFAKLVRLSEPFIVDLELRAKNPSMETLGDIARLAACRDKRHALSINMEEETPDWSEVDRDIVLQLILAALGIDAEQFKSLLPGGQLSPGTMFLALSGVQSLKTEQVRDEKTGLQTLRIMLGGLK